MIRIYRTEISHAAPSGRRQAELAAELNLLARALGPDAVLAHDPHGAPHVEGRPDLYVSVSHSADACVLAVSDTPVGVDVESPRPQLQRIAHKILTEAELAHAPYDITLLLRLWTAKEAVFKCAAIPSLVISEITVSLPSVSAESDVPRCVPFSGPTHAAAEARGLNFSIRFFPSGLSSILAVAVPSGVPEAEIEFYGGLKSV
ncbi:MAG: 4'-phosphopantetheinyl transferase superfamily protein [Duncaniella sp.]|nr:4'-phosphopantetheinyl transferase superfamily protein [Duncaniella sp.]